MELNKDFWNVYWGKFNINNVTINNQYLASTIPIYLMNNTPTNINHKLVLSESILVRDRILQNRVTEISAELTEKIIQRDDFFFYNDNSSSAYKNLLKDIAKLERDLEDVKNYLVKEDDLLKELPLKFLPSNTNNLSVIKDFHLKYYMVKNDIDYYITGNIEEVADNIIISVFLYSKYEEKPKEIWKGIGTTEEILNYRDLIIESIVKNIISDEIRVIKILSTPKNSLIYINDEFKSIGYFKGFYLKNNAINIKITKEGFYTVKKTFVVEDDNNLYNIDLNSKNTNLIMINTNPSGANVYYGSKFLGLTPLELPVSDFSQKLTLKLIDYIDSSVVVNPQSNNLNIKLIKGVLDKEKNFTNFKNKFYRASGIFSVSLAIPLYFYTQGDNINDIANYISIGHAVLWGGNLFFSLYQYLRAAEFSVE